MNCTTCGFDEFYGAHDGIVCARCGSLLRQSRDLSGEGVGEARPLPRFIGEGVGEESPLPLHKVAVLTYLE